VLLRETPLRIGAKLDRAGFVLSAAGFASLLLGLSKGASDGWGSLHIVGYLFVGAACLIMWIIVELHVEDPLVDLRVLGNTVYALSTAITFITTAAMFSTMFLLPLFLQNLRGLGAMEAGLLTFPQALASAMTMPISANCSTYRAAPPDPHRRSDRGILHLGAGQHQPGHGGQHPAADPDHARAGMGMMMMPSMTAAMNTVPRHLVGRASSLTNVLRQLFASFGTAVFATVLQMRESFHEAMLSRR